MQSKNFYIIFGAIMAIAVTLIVLFAVNLFFPKSELMVGSLNQNAGKDILVTPAPDIETTSRIPPLERKDPVVGDPEAPLTVIEFADFECQYCVDAQESVGRLLAAYPEKVRIVWKNFPLAVHAHSTKAAEAVLCANEQKKFEAMRDILFEKQRISLLPSNIKSYAQSIGLDAGEFNKCFDGGLNTEAVERDIASGRQYGVTGIPHFFVYKTEDTSQGYSIPWAATFSELKSVVDVLLK